MKQLFLTLGWISGATALPGTFCLFGSFTFDGSPVPLWAGAALIAPTALMLAFIALAPARMLR